MGALVVSLIGREQARPSILVAYLNQILLQSPQNHHIRSTHDLNLCEKPMTGHDTVIVVLSPRHPFAYAM